MNSIYIFPEAIHTEDTISLDLEENGLRFFCNNKRVVIDLAALRSGSSTVILKNPITGTVYPLFNFREILQVMDLGPQELLQTLRINGYVQIDKSGKDTFIKVFLPNGQPELKSRTHDFSRFPMWPWPISISWTGLSVGPRIRGRSKSIMAGLRDPWCLTAQPFGRSRFM
jgi:hypothetical protein